MLELIDPVHYGELHLSDILRSLSTLQQSSKQKDINTPFNSPVCLFHYSIHSVGVLQETAQAVLAKELFEKV
jgi:hypothetical protein